MGKKLIRNDFAGRTQFIDGAAKIEGVPEIDGSDGEIEARSGRARRRLDRALHFCDQLLALS